MGMEIWLTPLRSAPPHPRLSRMGSSPYQLLDRVGGRGDAAGAADLVAQFPRARRLRDGPRHRVTQRLDGHLLGRQMHAGARRPRAARRS